MPPIPELGLEWKPFAKAMELSDEYLRSVVFEVTEYYDDDDEEPSPSTRLKSTDPGTKDRSRPRLILRMKGQKYFTCKSHAKVDHDKEIANRTAEGAPPNIWLPSKFILV